MWPIFVEFLSASSEIRVRKQKKKERRRRIPVKHKSAGRPNKSQSRLNFYQYNHALLLPYSEMYFRPLDVVGLGLSFHPGYCISSIFFRNLSSELSERIQPKAVTCSEDSVI